MSLHLDQDLAAATAMDKEIDDGIAAGESAAICQLAAPVRARAREIRRDLPVDVILLVIGGSQAYGTDNQQSDIDLRGIYAQPLAEAVGLYSRRDVYEQKDTTTSPQVEIMLFEMKKFLQLMIKRNVGILELLASPLVVARSGVAAELVDMLPELATKGHMHVYMHMAQEEEKRWKRNFRVKTLLFIYRTYLTGIHLMRSGQVVLHLPTLAEIYQLPQVMLLVEAARAGQKEEAITGANIDFHQRAIDALTWGLKAAYDKSTLPEVMDEKIADHLHELLIETRLTSVVFGEGSPGKDTGVK